MRILPAAFFVVSIAFAASCNGPLYAVCDDPRRDCNMPAQGGQSIADYRQRDPAARPVQGGSVDFRSAVVSAVDDYPGRNGNVGNVWVQQHIDDSAYPGCAADPHGGRVCGMQLFAPTFIPAGSHVIPGDIVNVQGGSYDEFDCSVCGNGSNTFDGRTLPEVAMPSVERVGSTASPTPIDVTVAQLTDPATADDYVGVLVRITDVVMVGTTTSIGNLNIAAGLQMTQDLTAVVDPATRQPLAMGTRLQNIVGIASYFYQGNIIPRSVNDYEIVR